MTLGAQSHHLNMTTWYTATQSLEDIFLLNIDGIITFRANGRADAKIDFGWIKFCQHVQQNILRSAFDARMDHSTTLG